MLVVLANDLVYSFAIYARRTGPCFEMKDEVRVFDEGRAATKGAVNVLATMDGRPEMISKIVFAPKMSIAGRAVVMLVGLTIVLLQSVIVLEYFAADVAVTVLLLVMLFKLV